MGEWVGHGWMGCAGQSDTGHGGCGQRRHRVGHKLWTGALVSLVGHNVPWINHHAPSCIVCRQCVNVHRLDLMIDDESLLLTAAI